MSAKNIPPFKITPAIISLIAEISQMAGRLSVLEDAAKAVRLRRINRIRTIQGSLAIEGNTLSIEQITAILEGKRIIASAREIQEVRNAINAYELFEQWQPSSKNDLLDAHRILMTGLLDAPGKFRTGGVGVMKGKTVIHLAPPADRVPYLINELLHWLKTTDQHPLIAGSVFHYEFEFIHPFADGNGRMGRLWQTLILSKWNSLFANIPVESLVYEHQAEYYAALNQSTKNAESSVFIEFMLNVILQSMRETIKSDQVTDQVTDQVKKLLRIFDSDFLSASELMQKLNLSHRPTFRKNYLHPALNQGLIEMTVPDKPTSRLQKYRITPRGMSIILTPGKEVSWNGFFKKNTCPDLKLDGRDAQKNQERKTPR
jgi:Fic family protein